MSDLNYHYRRSVNITVDLNAIRHNLEIARTLSAGSFQFATIKADAYGHGAVAVANALSRSKASEESNQSKDTFADGFAVVTLQEALELRAAGIEEAILVLQGPQSSQAIESFVESNLWPVIHSTEQYHWLVESRLKTHIKAWMKIDTGMGRLGFLPKEASFFLNENNGIHWHGVMTHFACADEPQNPFTDEQMQVFNAVATPAGVLRSAANSAATLAWPATRADWGRPGIMLYGSNPLPDSYSASVSLVPAMTVTAPLLAVKTLPKGHTIGYGQQFKCPEEMPVGYVAAGYRDGIPRVLDNTARVAVNGQLCPIIGRVSMDSFAIDLRYANAVTLGDTVELWGKDAAVEHLATAAGTISYELLTAIRGSLHYIG